MEKLKAELVSLLNEYNYCPTDKGMDAVLNEWKKNKKALHDLFCKDPDYDQEHYQMVKTVQVQRPVDVDAIFAFFCWLEDNLKVAFAVASEDKQRKFMESGTMYAEQVYDWTKYMKRYTESTINEDAAQFCVYDTRIVKGQKTSRSVRKVCECLGLTKLYDFEQQYALYADAINANTFDRKFIISLNPYDFFTMSFGNSWSSCQTIDKRNIRNSPNSYEGMRSSGTMSYMLDETSFVTYVINKDVTSDYEKEDKIQRQMFHYKNGLLLQGRLYPQNNDSGAENIYKQYRQLVQETITGLLGVSNDWEVAKGSDECEYYTKSYGTHYRDYIEYNCCYICKLNGTYNERDRLVIGHNPICIECGYEHNNQEWITCCDNGRYTRCEHCGRHIRTSNAIEYNGNYYCGDCMVQTESGKYILRSEAVVVDDKYYTQEEFAEMMEVECVSCGAVSSTTEMVYVVSEEKWYCKDCFEAKFGNQDEQSA